MWMHWAICRCHSCLLRDAASASSQVSPILHRSLLTTLCQFVLSRPGPHLKPGTSQYSAWCEMCWLSICIRWPSQHSLLSLKMFAMPCCPVLALTSSLVALSFQETPNMLLCHLWWLVSSFFDNVVISSHNSALWRRVDKITDSYSRTFTFKHYYCSFRSFSFFQKLWLLFQCALWHPFQNFHYMKCSCQGNKSC